MQLKFVGMSQRAKHPGRTLAVAVTCI